MPIETVLIKTKQNTTMQQIQDLVRFVSRLGGDINIATQTMLIATIDNSCIELIREHPRVELVGGVNYKGRTIPKIIKRIETKK